jgi:hypothetical protein
MDLRIIYLRTGRSLASADVRSVVAGDTPCGISWGWYLGCLARLALHVEEIEPSEMSSPDGPYHQLLVGNYEDSTADWRLPMRVGVAGSASPWSANSPRGLGSSVHGGARALRNVSVHPESSDARREARVPFALGGVVYEPRP